MTSSPPRETVLDLRVVASLLKRHGSEFLTRFDGRSMEPTIPSGAEVLLRCPADEAVGSVVAVARGDLVIVHRIVARAADGRWLLTRGDAHALPDPPLVAADALIGSVVKVRRGDDLADLPPAPSSLGRRLALGVSRLALAAGLGPGRFVIGALILLRRWLLLVPRTLLARVLSRSRRP